MPDHSGQLHRVVQRVGEACDLFFAELVEKVVLTTVR